MSTDFRTLVGKSPEQARTLVPGFTVRVTQVDGQPCICTQELNNKRINVEVRNKVIVAVKGLG